MRRLAFAAALVAVMSSAAAGPRRGGRAGEWEAWRASVLDPDAVLVVVVNGQSNARGSGGVPVVSTVPSATDLVLCADDVTLQPLDENDLACLRLVSGTGGHSGATEGFATPQETPASGMVYALRQRLPSHQPAIVAVRCGYGGQVIANYDPDRVANPTWYADCLDRVQAVVDAVAASPATYGSISGATQVLGMGWWQGEADSIVGTAQAAYRAGLEELVDEFAVDVVAMTGQPFAPHVVTQPPTSYGSVSDLRTDPSPALLGHVEACLSRELLHCTGPNYVFDAQDQFHTDPDGHRLSGEAMGAALYKAVLEGYGDGLTLADAAFFDRHVVACFDVPVAPLVIDTTVTARAIGQGGNSPHGCNAHPGGAYGLEVFDTTGTPPTLSNVTLTNAKCIEATASRTIDSADAPVLRVAWTANTGNGVTRFNCVDDPDTAHSNFRDSRAPVPSYALPSQATLTQGQPDAGYDAGIGDAGALGFAFTGQSWMDSVNQTANHLPLITTGHLYNNQLAFDGGVHPLQNGAATNNEEWLPVSVMANLRALFDGRQPTNTTPPFTAVWSARSGARLDQIDCRDGVGAYAPTTTCQGLLDSAATAVAAGVTKIPIVFFAQEIGDVIAGTDPVAWCAAVEQFRADLETQFRLIPGYDDGGDALFLVMQSVGRHTRFGFSTTAYTDEMTACAAAHPYIFLGPPHGGHVDFNTVDTIHNAGNGQITMAGAFAQAGYELVFGGRDFEPLLMSGCALVTATEIDCTFHVPCRAYGTCADDPPIVIDTLRPGQHQWANSGFRLRGDSLGASITAVTPQACDAGPDCRVRLTLDRSPSSGTSVGLADEGDAGPSPSHTLPGSNLRATRSDWPDVGVAAAWYGGSPDDAGRPIGDDFPSPVSRAVTGIDAGLHADASAFGYANCNAVRFGGFSPNDNTTTGSLIEVSSAWANDAGVGLSGRTQWSVMMHYDHNPLSSSPLIRNVPFIQGWPGSSGSSLFVNKLEPLFGNDLILWFSSSNPGAVGSPWLRAPLSHNVETQVVIVFDGTAADVLDGGSDPRGYIYRWESGETGGLVDVGGVGQPSWSSGSEMPTAMGATAEPFTIGGGYNGGWPDMDGDLYSFAIWESALSPSEVAQLNSGAAVVDPRNVATAPDLYWNFDAENPGDPTVTDLMGAIVGTLHPAYTLNDGGLGAAVDGSIPQIVATGNCP